jgi:hypothetical protein
VFVVCAGLAVASAVYDRNPEALRSRLLTRGMGYLRGAETPPEDAPNKEKASATAKEAGRDVVEGAGQEVSVEKG